MSSFIFHIFPPMVPRFLTRPVVPALLAWAALGLVVFLAADLFVMPWAVGRYRPVTTVPYVGRLDTIAAADSLRAHGLRFAVDTAGGYSLYVRAGRVLSQTPDSGSVVKQGRRVWVQLSRGREPVIRPLRGR
jgi:beta-lactam-binding protein with PASTA domain